MKNKDDNEEKGIIVPVSSGRERERDRDRDRDRDYDRDKDRDRDRDHDREKDARRDRDKDRDHRTDRRESGMFFFVFFSLLYRQNPIVPGFFQAVPGEVGVITGSPIGVTVVM